MAGICIFFLSKDRFLSLKAFQYQIWLSVKISSIYQVRKILALFCILVALTLDWNCVKGIRVTKFFKQIKVEEFCGQLEARNCLQRQAFTKYLRKTLVFLWNSRFLPILTKFSFCEKDWPLGYDYLKFKGLSWYFLIS